MSAPQAAAITACTACAAVGGAAAGGAFSSGTSVDSTEDHQELEHTHSNNTNETRNNVTEEPNWYPITDEESSNKSGFSAAGNIGKDYEKYLVGAYGTTGKDNTPWWTKSFEKYTQDKAATSGQAREFSTLFKDEQIKDAFQASTASQGTNKALNKICLDAYKKNKSDITVAGSSGATSEQSKLRDDLWRYCSPLGETPKTIEMAQEENTYNGSENKIGKTKKSFLLSVTGTNNTKLWDIKNKEFVELADIGESGSKFFKDWQTKAKSKTEGASLKKACDAAYKLASTSDEEANTKVTDTNVVKYCSLLGTES